MFKRVAKSWGHYTDIFRSKYLCVKILTFLPNKHLSVQRHFHRYEVWIGRDVFMFIRPNQWHTFASEDGCSVLEFQFGTDVREDDIERV